MDGHPAAGSVVRVWLRADDNPDRVGHLAQIAKSHPEKGMHAKLLTTAVSNAHWLPMDVILDHTSNRLANLLLEAPLLLQQHDSLVGACLARE